MSQAKTKRTEPRLNPKDKNQPQQAATNSALTPTSFVQLTALKEAHIQQHEKTMSQRDQQRLFQILMSDDEPNPDLIEAVKTYRTTLNG